MRRRIPRAKMRRDGRWQEGAGRDPLSPHSMPKKSCKFTERMIKFHLKYDYV